MGSRSVTARERGHAGCSEGAPPPLKHFHNPPIPCYHTPMDQNEIQTLMQLASLELTEDEQVRFAGALDELLEYLGVMGQYTPPAGGDGDDEAVEQTRDLRDERGTGREFPDCRTYLPQSADSDQDWYIIPGVL